MKLGYLFLLALFTIGCGSYHSNTAGGMGAAAMANIADLVPGSATAGGPGFTMTLNGTNFATNSVVFFNGSAMNTMFVTGSQLMAAIPASEIAATGSKPVYVNSVGNIYGVNSNTVTFTVN